MAVVVDVRRFQVKQQRIRRKWFIRDIDRKTIWGPFGLGPKYFPDRDKAESVCAILNDWQHDGIFGKRTP